MFCGNRQKPIHTFTSWSLLKQRCQHVRKVTRPRERNQRSENGTHRENLTASRGGRSWPKADNKPSVKIVRSSPRSYAVGKHWRNVRRVDQTMKYWNLHVHWPTNYNRAQHSPMQKRFLKATNPRRCERIPWQNRQNQTGQSAGLTEEMYMADWEALKLNNDRVGMWKN